MKTFRVFISSTFSDFVQEREILQQRVFPKLVEDCQKRGSNFQAVDLRWGVSEDMSIQHDTMSICLSEIKRSQRLSPKPNFIILSGDRYGWEPLPTKISTKDFIKILSAVHSADDRNLIEKWYTIDNNEVPASYFLKPKYNHYKNNSVWSKTEKNILDILRLAVRDLVIDQKLFINLHTSATHQEIIEGISNTEDYGSHIFSLFRSIENISGDPKFTDIDEEKLHVNREKIEKLRNYIEINTKSEIYKVNVSLEKNTLPENYLNEFSERVYQFLHSIIKKELDTATYPKESGIIANNDLETKHYHLKKFIGREDIIEEIMMQIQKNELQPIIVVGKPGMGKSALLAKIWAVMEEFNSELLIICRFVGVDVQTYSSQRILESIVREIINRLGITRTVPTLFDDLVDVFNDLLENVTRNNRILIIIDGIDQLPYNELKKIKWLILHKQSVDVLISSTYGDYYDYLKNECFVITLDKLTDSESMVLLKKLLMENNRTLQENQWLVIKPMAIKIGSPLYLNLIQNQLITWTSELQADQLPESLQIAIMKFINGLSSIKGHGKMFVKYLISFLSASRTGLTEDEIIYLLSNNKNVMDEYRNSFTMSADIGRIPDILLSRFRLDISKFLKEISWRKYLLISFYHKEFDRVISSEYFIDNGFASQIHKELADYFDHAGFENERTLKELIYHCTMAAKFRKGDLGSQSLYQTLSEYLLSSNLIKKQIEIFGDYNQSIEDLRLVQDLLIEHADEIGEQKKINQQIMDISNKIASLLDKANSDIDPAFEAMEYQPLDDPERIEFVLRRLSFLQEEHYIKAITICIAIEAERQSKLVIENRSIANFKRLLTSFDEKIKNDEDAKLPFDEKIMVMIRFRCFIAFPDFDSFPHYLQIDLKTNRTFRHFENVSDGEKTRSTIEGYFHSLFYQSDYLNDVQFRSALNALIKRGYDFNYTTLLIKNRSRIFTKPSDLEIFNGMGMNQFEKMYCMLSSGVFKYSENIWYEQIFMDYINHIDGSGYSWEINVGSLGAYEEFKNDNFL
jgi:hypothetical protein